MIPHDPQLGLDVRLVVDAIPALAWSSHPDNAVEFVNQKWCDFTGLALKSRTAGDGRPLFIPKICQNCLRTGGGLEKVREYDVRLRRADGAFHWFLLRREPLHDEAGAVVRWHATRIDIEESRQKELLRVAEKRTLELIADGAILSCVLNELCAAIDEYTSATSLVF